MSGAAVDVADDLVVEEQLEDGVEPRHIVWVKDLQMGLKVGVMVPALCGVWVEPFEPRSFVKSIGDFVPVYESEDCPDCTIAYDRWAAREMGLPS